MKTRNLSLFSAAAVSLLMIAGATAGHAVERTGLSVDPASSGPVSASVLAADGQLREELYALVGTQSPAEIDAILTSGIGATGLAGEDGTYIAAIETPQSMSTSAVTPLAPGCSTTSSCLYLNAGGTGVGYGYTGIGQLAISRPHIFKAVAGNAVTTLTSSLDYKLTILSGNSAALLDYYVVNIRRG